MAQLAIIQHGNGPDKKWRPDVFHRVHPDQVGPKKLWWYQGIDGISVLGEDAVRRTRGKPRTLNRIVTDYGTQVQHAVMDVFGSAPWLHRFDDGPTAARTSELYRLLFAVMATESGGRLKAERYEKRLNDWSFGPMQILTNTARSLALGMGMVGRKDPLAVPKGGSPDWWRNFLASPYNSLVLAAELLKGNNKRWKLQGDPVLLYATYNAGGPYASKQTPWGLRAYDRDGPGPEWGALDHFAAWYGDACVVR